MLFWRKHPHQVKRILVWFKLSPAATSLQMLNTLRLKNGVSSIVRGWAYTILTPTTEFAVALLKSAVKDAHMLDLCLSYWTTAWCIAPKGNNKIWGIFQWTYHQHLYCQGRSYCCWLSWVPESCKQYSYKNTVYRKVCELMRREWNNIIILRCILWANKTYSQVSGAVRRSHYSHFIHTFFHVLYPITLCDVVCNFFSVFYIVMLNKVIK